MPVPIEAFRYYHRRMNGFMDEVEFFYWLGKRLIGDTTVWDR